MYIDCSCILLYYTTSLPCQQRDQTILPHSSEQVLQAHAACAAVRAFASAQGGPQPLLLAGDFNSLAEKRVSDEFDEGALSVVLSSGLNGSRQGGGLW